MVGWEHSRAEATLNATELAELAKNDSPFSRFTLECCQACIDGNLEWLGEVGLSLPDPVTMAIALDPTVCTERGRYHVDVEIQSDLTRGMTLVDRFDYAKKPANLGVCWSIDVAKWKSILHQALQAV